MFMAGQRRHYLHTVHKKHIASEDMADNEFIALVRVLVEGLEEDKRIRYFCGQIEKCPDSGRLHAQMYTEWKSSRRITEVIKAIPSHVENRKGTRTEARDYCRKAETRVIALGEFGEWRPESQAVVRPAQKEIALDCLVKFGMSPEQIALEHPHVYFTHHFAIDKLYAMRGGGF